MTTLRVVLDCGEPLRTETALVVLADVLGAMASAHENGEFHPDLTAEAVLVDAEGRIAVTGFAAPEAETGATPLDAPRYRAPERWAALAPNMASDLYSATALFYEALAGNPPFEAADLGELRARHERAPIPAGDVPPGISGLITAGLAKEAADRPSGARDFLGAVGLAASAECGGNWPERGRAELSERIAPLLAALRGEVRPVELPAAAAAVAGASAAPLPPVPGARTAEDDKEAWRKRAIGVLGAAAVIGAVIAVFTSIGGGPAQDGLPHSNSATSGGSATTSGGVVRAAPGTSTRPGGSVPGGGAPAAPGGGPSSAPGRAVIAGSPPLAPVSATSQEPGSGGSSPAPGSGSGSGSGSGGTTSPPSTQPPVTTTPAQPGPASASRLTMSTSCDISPAQIVVGFTVTATSPEPLTVTANGTADAVVAKVSGSKQLSGGTSYQGTITLPISRWAGWGGNWWTIDLSTTGASKSASLYC